MQRIWCRQVQIGFYPVVSSSNCELQKHIIFEFRCHLKIDCCILLRGVGLIPRQAFCTLCIFFLLLALLLVPSSSPLAWRSLRFLFFLGPGAVITTALLSTLFDSWLSRTSSDCRIRPIFSLRQATNPYSDSLYFVKASTFPGGFTFWAVIISLLTALISFKWASRFLISLLSSFSDL